MALKRRSFISLIFIINFRYYSLKYLGNLFVICIVFPCFIYSFIHFFLECDLKF